MEKMKSNIYYLLLLKNITIDKRLTFKKHIENTILILRILTY